MMLKMKLITNEQGNLELINDRGEKIDHIKRIRLNKINCSESQAVSVTCEIFIDSIDVKVKSELIGSMLEIQSYCPKCGWLYCTCDKDPNYALESNNIFVTDTESHKVIGHILDLGIKEDFSVDTQPKMVMTKVKLGENNEPMFGNDEVLVEQEGF